MVCSIIANRVVYVNYKNVYKKKRMVLNCQIFTAGPRGVDHDTRFEAADGVECHLPLCVNSSDVTDHPY